MHLWQRADLPAKPLNRTATGRKTYKANNKGDVMWLGIQIGNGGLWSQMLRHLHNQFPGTLKQHKK